MTSRVAYTGFVLSLALGIGSGCGDDDDDKLGGLERSAVLGELDDAEQKALCDVSDQLGDEAIADGEGRRATCFSQLVADLQVALLNVDFSPDHFSLDTVVEQCEAALDRCIDDGPKRRACDAIEFEAGCRATVGDYGHCLEQVLAATRAYATTDCRKYVSSEAERERVAKLLAQGLKSCSKVLSCDAETTPDAGMPSWFDGGVGQVDVDARPLDTRSNEQWLAEIDRVAQETDRPGCDAALAHDTSLDDEATTVAAAPIGTRHDFDFVAEWKWISVSDLDFVLARVQAYLDETGSACSWKRYGLGVVGEPGDDRVVVVLIAE